MFHHAPVSDQRATYQPTYLRAYLAISDIYLPPPVPGQWNTHELSAVECDRGPDPPTPPKHCVQHLQQLCCSESLFPFLQGKKGFGPGGCQWWPSRNLWSPEMVSAPVWNTAPTCRR